MNISTNYAFNKKSMGFGNSLSKITPQIAITKNIIPEITHNSKHPIGKRLLMAGMGLLSLAFVSCTGPYDETEQCEHHHHVQPSQADIQRRLIQMQEVLDIPAVTMDGKATITDADDTIQKFVFEEKGYETVLTLVPSGEHELDFSETTKNLTTGKLANFGTATATMERDGSIDLAFSELSDHSENLQISGHRLSGILSTPEGGAKTLVIDSGGPGTLIAYISGRLSRVLELAKVVVAKH